jgi:hypothetical protein
MQIHFVDKETMFHIEIMTEESEDPIKLRGFFYEAKGSMALILEGDEVYDYFTKNPLASRLSMTFYRDKQKYFFHAKFERSFIKFKKKLTEFSVASIIEVTSRRSAHRFDIAMNIMVHEMSEDYEPIYSSPAHTFDMSYDAICFYSNTDLTNENPKIEIEFLMFGKDRFRLPARLLHKHKVGQSKQFKHSYVFLFDFSECPDEKKRLVDSFFTNNFRAKADF